MFILLEQGGGVTLLTVNEEYQIQCPKYLRYSTNCIDIIQHRWSNIQAPV